MRIAKIYSHLNGLEFLQLRKQSLWLEIVEVIKSVDAGKCRNKISRERGMHGKRLYSPRELNAEFRTQFSKCKPPWERQTFSYYVCEDERTTRLSQHLGREEQKQAIMDAGFRPLETSNETDFVKDRVAVEVQFGKYSFVAHDIFVKHLAFYAADKIDVGVEILPMKDFEREMSSGPTFFEKDLSNILRQGRGVPGVPLVVLGVDA